MNQIPELSKLCRLCLKNGVRMVNIFGYSSKLKAQIVDIILKCAPVEIMRHDKLPTFICRICYTQLKKIHQFQLQAVKSDKKLRRCLQLRTSHQQTKVDCAIEKSNNLVNQNSNTGFTIKSEPLENSDVFDESNHWEEKANYNAGNQIKTEMTLKSKIKEELIDGSLTAVKFTNDTLSNVDGNEINNEETKIDIGDMKVENFKSSCSADGKYVTENSNKDDDGKSLQEKHFKNKSFQCDFCDKSFTQLISLKKHNTLVHGGIEQSALYNYRFNPPSLLKKTSVHTKEKPYQCDVCNKCFSFPSNLKRHTLVHTGDKLFQCNVCNKGFTISSSLKRHTLVHTGEKPYQCDICNKCFNESVKLKIHMRAHTGEKPYPCDVCSKSFITSSDLKRHMRVHTKEKPYQCDICRMRFTASSSLKKHGLIHSGNSDYTAFLTAYM